MDKMSRNLFLVKYLAAAAGCRFGLGIWVLYYLKFTSYAGIGLAEALMIVVAFVVEVPTGQLADLLGRKNTLLCAFALFTTGFILIAMAPAYTTLLAGLLVFVLGRALYSGTFQALVYDSLQTIGQTGRYGYVLAQLQFWRLAALAVSCSVGGYAFTWWFRAPYFLTVLACFVGLVLTFFLSEPKLENSGDPGAKNNLWSLFKTICGQIFRDQLPRYMLVLAAVLVFCEEILDDALAVTYGFEPQQLGLLFSGIYLLCALIARSSAGWVSRQGHRKALIWLAAIAGATLCLSPWLGLVFGGISIAVRYSVRTVWENVENEAVNQMTISAHRATALSTYTMLKSLPYVLFAFPLGAFLDQVGPQRVSWLFGGLLAIGLLLWYGQTAMGCRNVGTGEKGDGGIAD